MEAINKDSPQQILARITELRLKKGVSEKQMSRDIGKAPSYLSSMLKNKSLPSTKVLLDICDYLGISMADFFELDVENPVLIREIVRDLEHCDDDELQVIASLVKLICSLKQARSCDD